jgi:hypothetical protein
MSVRLKNIWVFGPSQLYTDPGLVPNLEALSCKNRGRIRAPHPFFARLPGMLDALALKDLEI